MGNTSVPVSYTHLDVYKRQERERQAEEAELRALEEEWEEKWAKTDPNASLFERLFQAIGPDPDWVE